VWQQSGRILARKGNIGRSLFPPCVCPSAARQACSLDRMRAHNTSARTCRTPTPLRRRGTASALVHRSTRHGCARVGTLLHPSAAWIVPAFAVCRETVTRKSCGASCCRTRIRAAPASPRRPRNNIRLPPPDGPPRTLAHGGGRGTSFASRSHVASPCVIAILESAAVARSHCTAWPASQSSRSFQ